MGGALSKARGHFITRPVQRFNIEARTEKVLDKEKPMPAPKYKADIESRQMNLEQHWEKMDKDIKSKDENHSKRLKDVSPKINYYSGVQANPYCARQSASRFFCISG